MDKMRDDAIREAARNAAVDEYFKARPQLMWTLHDKRLVEAGFDRGWQAAQSVQYAEDHVISIAGAYESGIGHCNDNLCNPYKVGSAESFAYDYGKEFGKARGIEQSVPVVGEVVDYDDDIKKLMRFYAVNDLISLSRIQSERIARLQKKLPTMRDEQPRNPRSGGE